MYEVKILNSLDGIRQEYWDSLVEDKNVFFTHQWFKIIEESMSKKLEPRYVLIYEEKELIAAAPCYIQHDFPFSTVDDIFWGRALKTLRSFGVKITLLPSLVCFSPFSHSGRVLFSARAPRHLILDLVLKKMDEICKKEKLPSCVFLDMPEESFLTKTLPYRGFLKLKVEPVAYLDIRWKNFEDYLVDCKHKLRREIRRQIRRNQESGIKIEFMSCPPQSLCQALFELYKNVYSKYWNKPSSVFYDFYRGILERLSDHVNLFLAKTQNDKLVGFCLGLNDGRGYSELWYGCNYEEVKKNTYFVLVYYEPIKRAIEKNIERVYLGTTTYSVKTRLGCKLENRYGFLKLTNEIFNKLAVFPLRVVRKI